MSQIHLINKEERNFQLWEYHVSHGQLLIRSPKAKSEKNIDLIFAGVEYVSIPRQMKGLRTEAANMEDLSHLNEIIGKLIDQSKVTVICSARKRYFVVAAGMKVNESDCDIFDSPFEKM